MEFNIDELTALVLQNSRLAKQSRKAAAELLTLADEYDKLAIVYLEVGKRMNREDEAKEGKMNIRKIISGVSMLVVMMLVFSLVYGSRLTLAQDVTLATNTPQLVATAQPTIEVTAEPNINVPSQPGGTLVVGWNAISNFIGILIAAMAGGFLLSLGTIIVVIRQVRQNEIIKDFGQKIYMSQPVGMREKERQVVELGKELVGLADDVTAVDAPTIGTVG